MRLIIGRVDFLNPRRKTKICRLYFRISIFPSLQNKIMFNLRGLVAAIVSHKLKMTNFHLLI